MKFNEDSRVKIPTILHLIRLGYDYLSLKGNTWNEDTNIFPDIFLKSILSINKELYAEDAKRLLDDVSLLLDNEDLGKAFFERLTEKSGIKLIDFENFNNNTFNVVIELTYKKDDEEFRPDIILLINGMPLVFIEVKKPNNKNGVLAERQRINTRFQNKKFINITNSISHRANVFLENQQLTKLRDWLLPMLMNGQVTVKQAQVEIQLDMVAEPKAEYTTN